VTTALSSFCVVPFARSGDLNSAGAPVWAALAGMSDLFQSLQPPTPTTGFATDHKCACSEI